MPIAAGMRRMVHRQTEPESAVIAALTRRLPDATLPIMPVRVQPPNRPPGCGWIPFLAHFLLILAAWTLVIKYLFPIAFAAANGLPLTTHVFWDAWPIFHVWLAWLLLNWKSHTRIVAIAMSAIEIAIIVTLFHRFLSGPDPEWTIWRTNWFINKVFVLSCFILILGTFCFFRRHVETYRKSITPPP